MDTEKLETNNGADSTRSAWSSRGTYSTSSTRTYQEHIAEEVSGCYAMMQKVLDVALGKKRRNGRIERKLYVIHHIHQDAMRLEIDPTFAVLYLDDSTSSAGGQVMHA